jgi:hypothetical protein
MLGAVIFIYALTSYLSLHLKDARIHIGEEASRPYVTPQPLPVGLPNQARQSS